MGRATGSKVIVDENGKKSVIAPVPTDSGATAPTFENVVDIADRREKLLAVQRELTKELNMLHSQWVRIKAALAGKNAVSDGRETYLCGEWPEPLKL